jgi:hypothetical protein
VLKVFGQMYPSGLGNAGMVALPKFTSFFKQISFYLLGENLPFETVTI